MDGDRPATELECVMGQLGRELHHVLWRLEPTETKPNWDELPECEREAYVHAVRAVLNRRDVVRRALNLLHQ